MVPQMLLDLILAGSFNPFVTGADFYTGTQMYREEEGKRRTATSGGSNDTSNNGYPMNWPAIVQHDPISNFQLIRNLFGAQMVDGDSKFRRALTMPVDEYASLLEGSYRVHSRDLGISPDCDGRTSV